MQQSPLMRRFPVAPGATEPHVHQTYFNAYVFHDLRTYFRGAVEWMVGRLY